MEFLKDIAINLVSDAVWVIGGAVSTYLFLKKDL